ncbi:MAG: segregation/condensation protein A [Nanoarchaeota archaeon]
MEKEEFQDDLFRLSKINLEDNVTGNELEPQFVISSPQNGKVGQEQIHTLLFGETLSWQAIIYDLINTEQLDPWDINLSFLASKFLEKVRQLEEANFFISSKVLFAASLLLRMKSEVLLEKDIQNLDDTLFGKKEQKKYIQERLELDEEIPELILRTPLPRFKKVTLEELIRALDVAIKTENRRIQKVVITKQQEFETSLSLPKNRVNLQDSIKQVQKKLEEIFKLRENPLPFTDLAGGKQSSKEQKINTFVPLLHLDNQQKVWLEQNGHREEIWIILKQMYESKNKELLAKLKAEVESEIGKLDIHDDEATIQEELTAEEEKRFNSEMFIKPASVEDEDG